jgi:hypothetical protein
LKKSPTKEYDGVSEFHKKELRYIADSFNLPSSGFDEFLKVCNLKGYLLNRGQGFYVLYKLPTLPATLSPVESPISFFAV